MRTSKRNFRLAGGLMAASLALSVILLVWQIWSAQRDERALILRQTEHRAGQLATAVAEHIAVFTRAIDFVLLELRREYGMQDAHFRETVTLLLKSFPEGTIVQFSVANANGDLTYSNLGPAPAVSLRDREHFTAHLDGADRLFISKPVFGRVSKQWSIQFSRPVLRDGRFAGVIVVSIAPAYFGKVLALLDLEPTDNAALFHASGAFLAHSRAINEVMDKSAPPSAPFLGADAPERGVLRANSVSNNRDQIFGWARVTGTSLVANIGLDVDAALGPMEQRFVQRWINAGGFAVAFIALGIVALALVSRLGRRQQSLVASEQRFRDLTELSTDWYWEQDAGLRFSFLSPGLSARGALTPGSVLGKLRWELPIVNVSEEQWQAHRALLARREPFHDLVYEVAGENGDRHWHSVSGKPVFGAEGQFLGYRGTGHDITERVCAERALRESEERYRDLIENSHDLICTHDLEGKLLSVNEAAVRLTGYPREALLGRTIAAFLDPTLRPSFAAYLTEIRTAGVAHGIMRIRTAGGENRLWEYNNTLRTEPVPMVRGMAHDVTERMRVEKALRESEARLREAQRMAHLGNWELDLVNNALTWSDEIPRIFEIEPERSGASYEDFLASVHPDDRDAVNTASTRSARERVPYEITHRLLMTDGRIKHVHVRYETAYDEHGRPLRSTGTVQDISEQKQVEAELRGYAHRLREVSRRLAQVQEMERRQVAGELHDSMGRDLTALAINLDLIRAQLPAQVLAGVEERLDDAQALVGAAMQNVRSVVAGLRPALLEEWGLLPALRWYAVEFSKRAAIPVDVVITGQEARLPDEAELALFRVAQEALLNCTKHARASRIDISLEMIPGRATLTITDDGAGFIVENLDSGRRTPGLGLALMHERMEAVGGRLRMVSSPGRGTRITAAIES
jgi:PAS domain S-box-containing protein